MDLIRQLRADLETLKILDIEIELEGIVIADMEVSGNAPLHHRPA